MPRVRALVRAWRSDDPEPCLIEVVLEDADGNSWTFVDKPPVFSELPISKTTPFPFEVDIECTVVEEHGERVVVSTDVPWGISDATGKTHFTLRREQLADF